tara:strand:+ start:82 stop:318 length:237 start_codon:yes stop_codon:yes gene_type:complete
MLSQKKIIEIISKSVQQKVDLKSSSKNIEGWDSLAQLNILSSLDKITKGKSSKIEQLTELNSVKGIIQILLKKNLIKK